MKTARFQARSGSVLHVEESGTGLPLLALHGLGGGAWFFSGLHARLADRCRVIALDLPGTGRSQAAPGGSGPADLRQRPADSMTIAAWVHDVLDLVTRHVGEPVAILGHSLGTILAIHAAATSPESTRAMIFVGGLPAPRPEIRERLMARAAAVRRNGLDGVGATAAAANFARATFRAQPELVGMFERLFELQDAAGYVRCAEILIEASATELLPRVAVPCLSIVGAEDQYAPPALVGAFVQQLPVTCRNDVMEDCGHLPFLEAPDRFAGLVASFLGTLC